MLYQHLKQTSHYGLGSLETLFLSSQFQSPLGVPSILIWSFEVEPLWWLIEKNPSNIFMQLFNNKDTFQIDHFEKKEELNNNFIIT